jgi:rhodanese-related sulfurtransferase
MTESALQMYPVAEVDVATLRDWLADGREIALLDVRDGGPFSRGHLLLATNMPLARLEILAPLLLPRRSVRLVLLDEGSTDLPEGGASEAQRAARRLVQAGYNGVHVLAGGLRAWAQAGFEVFSGTNVPSKTFGEWVEHRFDTPRIDAQTLHRWQAESRDVVLVDARPAEEYRMVSLPGASDCPGAELALRVPALLRSPQTVVVVNCAGRTRSIIGCQSLRNAGVVNPVYALKDGTMGWQLAGFEPMRGRDNLIPEPDQQGLAQAQAMAREVARRFRVRFIDEGTLERWQSETERTTYVFDVRLPSAYAQGHRPGSVNAPGGQLVQSTDTYAAVRHARIVLVDRHAVQAVMTAHWLQGMGWTDVHVLSNGLHGPLEQGGAPLIGLDASSLTAETLEPHALHAVLGQVRVIDVGESFLWRLAGIPASCYAMRSHLAEALRLWSRETPLVFSCGDGRLSRYAAQDALQLGFSSVRALAGGRAAWRAAGLPLAPCPTDEADVLTPTDDMWYPPWARASGVHEAIQQYLTWEVNLVEQVRREPYFRFPEDDPAWAPLGPGGLAR